MVIEKTYPINESRITRCEVIAHILDSGTKHISECIKELGLETVKASRYIYNYIETKATICVGKIEDGIVTETKIIRK